MLFCVPKYGEMKDYRKEYKEKELVTCPANSGLICHYESYYYLLHLVFKQLHVQQQFYLGTSKYCITATCIDLETNLVVLEAKLQMTSCESMTPIGCGAPLTNENPAI